MNCYPFPKMKSLRFSIFILFLSWGSAAMAQTVSPSEFEFEEGDLLFQELACGPLCEAIVRVTDSWNDRKYSHMGIVVIQQDSLFVLEAIGQDVHLVTLRQFLSRHLSEEGKPKVALGRLKASYRHLIPKALEFGLSQVGLPYDEVFLYDNGAYYCSELIYDSFLHANEGREIFELNPMTFKDPETGITFSIWEDYYRSFQIPVPEGELGCNPGGLSLSEKIDMLLEFY
jgi:hypothetical protein